MTTMPYHKLRNRDKYQCKWCKKKFRCKLSFNDHKKKCSKADIIGLFLAYFGGILGGFMLFLDNRAMVTGNVIAKDIFNKIQISIYLLAILLMVYIGFILIQKIFIFRVGKCEYHFTPFAVLPTLNVTTKCIDRKRKGLYTTLP